MNRNGGLILALALMALVPAAAHAQNNCKGGNNMHTRSAALYLDRAQKNGNPQQREELFRQALEQSLESTKNDADNPRSWFMAGQTYLRLQQYAAADSMFDRLEQLCANYEGLAIERTNAWVTAYNAGVTAGQQGDIEGAIASMQRADMMYQGRPEARLNLGSYYANLGKHEEAIAAFRGALEILRGPASEGLNEEQKAQWQENEQVAAFNLAQLLAIAGKDEEAAQAYRDYLASDPGNVTAQQNLAVVLTRQGKTADAATIYSELLGRTDLDAEDYFGIGVGLFNAEQHGPAADAFRKAIEKNPQFRDALYNLAQALYAPSLTLEDARAQASAADVAKINAQLTPIYNEIVESVEKARQYDPANANLYLLAARAYRGLADITANKAASDALREKVRATLEAQQALPVQVSQITLLPGETETTLTGSLGNLKLEAGAPVRLRVSFLGADGATLADAEVSLTAPAVGESVPFEVKATVNSADVRGWKYEIL